MTILVEAVRKMPTKQKQKQKQNKENKQTKTSQKKTPHIFT